MIRKAHKDEYNSLMEFLQLDSDNNFFLIGDLETFGIESKIHCYYVYEIANKIAAVLLRFNQTFLYFDPNNKLSWDQIINFASEHKLNNINISEKMFIHNQQHYMSNSSFVIHKQYLAKLTQKTSIDTSGVVKAQREDIENIVKSRLTIAEFKDFFNTFDKELQLYLEAYDAGVSNPFIIKDKNNTVLSCATVQINVTDRAFIGGVYTIDSHRKQGLASKTVAALANWIIEQNKTPMLFYHNEKAGRIYQNLGFKNIGILYTIVINY